MTTMMPEPGVVSRSAPRAPVLRRRTWDRLGTFLSGLCLVHCLLVPAALVALPGWTLLGTVHEAAHVVLALTLLPVTLVAVRPRSPRTTQELWAARLLWVGIGFVWLALPAAEMLGEVIEIALTVVGSVILMAGHLSRLNHHLSHHDARGCSTDGPNHDPCSCSSSNEPVISPQARAFSGTSPRG